MFLKRQNGVASCDGDAASHLLRRSFQRLFTDNIGHMLLKKQNVVAGCDGDAARHLLHLLDVAVEFDVDALFLILCAPQPRQNLYSCTSKASKLSTCDKVAGQIIIKPAQPAFGANRLRHLERGKKKVSGPV